MFCAIAPYEKLFIGGPFCRGPNVDLFAIFYLSRFLFLSLTSKLCSLEMLYDIQNNLHQRKMSCLKNLEWLLISKYVSLSVPKSSKESGYSSTQSLQRRLQLYIFFYSVG